MREVRLEVDIIYDACHNPWHNATIYAKIHDIDDVEDPDGTMSGQLDCDSDSEEMKVTPVSGSTELVDFRTFD